ncbi:MAG: alpha/beta hydrolase [Bacteroidales bacterium]|nr:alpha/beta hydrolase [Bacteroidales bacterium]
MKTIKFQQKQIAYHKKGEGKCLVLLHGFPMDSRVWKDFMVALSENFCVIAPDLPGLGKSEMIAERHDMGLMADVVAAILEAEQIHKCVLAGHSMGGYVGLAFANKYAEKLAGLALLHSHASADDAAGRENRNQAILKIHDDKKAFLTDFAQSLFDEEFAANTPDAVRFITDITLSQEKLAVVAAMAGMRERESHIELLSKLKVPVLFVLGKSDSRMPLVKIMAQAGLPQHAELLMLEGVGHVGFLESPLIVREALKAFVLRCYLLVE